jgi:phosphopantothenoylcysteine synthetase/decarboxylase
VAGPQGAVPGPGELTEGESARLRVIHVETVPDLIAALRPELAGPAPPDAVVHAMAVLDYAPEPAEGKTPSGRAEWTLTMRPTPKVIGLIRQWAPGALLVGFKLEAGADQAALREAALALLRANRADLAVANDLHRITDEAHPALILDADGQVLASPRTKAQVAAALCDLLAERL